jgi:hypothetical protein
MRNINFNNFYHPFYILPLINAVPPLFTNIIDNNNTFSSAISKFNFNQLTLSNSDDDASSDFTPTITIYTSRGYKLHYM